MLFHHQVVVVVFRFVYELRNFFNFKLFMYPSVEGWCYCSLAKVEKPIPVTRISIIAKQFQIYES